MGLRPQTPYRGSSPGPHWGTSSPRSPTRALPLDPIEVPFFYIPPNNPVDRRPWNILTYWATLCLAAPPPTERTWSHARNIFDADCTTSYVLNSGVTEPNLTKYLQCVQKWLPITLLKSKLWSSNPFENANIGMTNEDRNVIIAIKPFESGFTIGQYPLWNAKARRKNRSTWRLRTSPQLNWLS